MLPPKHILSKTTFLYGCQCHKRLWLYKKSPKLRDVMSVEQAAVFARGTDVGLLAQQLFPGGVDASPMQTWLYQQAVYNTEKYIRQGHQIIYEAAFQFEGVLCAVDMLVKTRIGWIAYEVKSTLSLKPTHIQDAALQYFVISNSGLQLTDMVLLHLNKSYLRAGELELKKLFRPVSILPQVTALQQRMESKLHELKNVLQQKEVPNIDTGAHCLQPYPCDFLGHCFGEGLFKTDIHNAELQINNNLLHLFKQTQPKGLYFLHLQTWMSAVPLCNGHWPYRNIPFAITIGDTSSENILSVSHTSLDNKFDDPLKLIASLKENLPATEKVLVANKSLVSYLLKTWANEFPQEADYLQQLVNNLEDFSTLLATDSYETETILLESNADGREKLSAHNASALFFNLDKIENAENEIAILEYGKEVGVAVIHAMHELILKSAEPTD